MTGMLSDPDSLVPQGKTYQMGCEYCRCVSLKHMHESENLDGSRFMLQQHIKLLFREEPGNGMPDWLSSSGAQQGRWLSNDMQLTYSLHKYASRHSFILPCDGAEQLCIDADVDRGSVGATTRGERITVRTDYIFRLFSRGSLQVWSERLRFQHASAPLLFAHSRAHAMLMLRLVHILGAENVPFLYIAVTAHAGVQGTSEAEMRGVFEFGEYDRDNQRLGLFALNIAHDFPRARSSSATLAETVTHMSEVLKATAPSLVFLPRPTKRTQILRTPRKQQTSGHPQSSSEHAEQEAAITGAHLAAKYLGIPVVYVDP